VPGQNVILDVCHNYQGIEQVVKQLPFEFPQIKKLKILFCVSISKVLEQTIELFNKSDLISEVHVISKISIKTARVDDAHARMEKCTKL